MVYNKSYFSKGRRNMFKYPLAVTIDTNILDAAKYDLSDGSTLQLLKNYVDRLKKEDIVNFAIKKNILLDKNELEVVYHNIKTRFKDIYDDGLKVIEENKNSLKETTYRKLKELYENTKRNYF